jgi:hypothetical protein
MRAFQREDSGCLVANESAEPKETASPPDLLKTNLHQFVRNGLLGDLRTGPQQACLMW